MGKSRRRGKRRHGGSSGHGGRGNYFYIPGPGTGVFSPTVYAFQVRNLPHLPGITPVVTNKFGNKHYRVQKYASTLYRL